MFQASADSNVTGMREADVALHRTICELSGNRHTLRAHEAIDTEVTSIACVDLELESLAFTAAICRLLRLWKLATHRARSPRCSII